MWNFPNQESNTSPLQWKCKILTTGPSGKSREWLFSLGSSMMASVRSKDRKEVRTGALALWRRARSRLNIKGLRPVAGVCLACSKNIWEAGMAGVGWARGSRVEDETRRWSGGRPGWYHLVASVRTLDLYSRMEVIGRFWPEKRKDLAYISKDHYEIWEKWWMPLGFYPSTWKDGAARHKDGRERNLTEDMWSGHIWNVNIWDFSGGPVVEVLRGPRFLPWSRNWDPTAHGVDKKKKMKCQHLSEDVEWRAG